MDTKGETFRIPFLEMGTTDFNLTHEFPKKSDLGAGECPYRLANDPRRVENTERGGV